MTLISFCWENLLSYVILDWSLFSTLFSESSLLTDPSKNESFMKSLTDTASVSAVERLASDLSSAIPTVPTPTTSLLF
jgi:hypothetical protein